MSGNFTWILDAKVMPYLGKGGGISSTYVIPNSHMLTDPREIPGSLIWIVLRSNQSDILFGLITVASLQQFEDGYNLGDYLLNINPEKSFRIISAINNVEPKISATTKEYPVGLSLLKNNEQIQFFSDVKSRVAINFRKPIQAVFSKISSVSHLGSSEMHARSLLTAIISNLALDDIWASPTVEFPFANFALLFIQQMGEKHDQNLQRLLLDRDPIKSLRTYLAYSPEIKDDHLDANEAPTVDTLLIPLNPEMIYARKFIQRNNVANFVDLAGKLEQAEKNHQDMLRDITEYLIKLGFQPLHSSSIDLALQIDGKIHIFEIKSTNIKNIMAQCSKGLFQLISYKQALVVEHFLLGSATLILQKIPSENFENHIEMILKSVEIKLLKYDSAANWPERVNMLREILIG